MSSPLEVVVRPFSLPANAPAQIYLDNSQNPNTPVRLSVGRGGGTGIIVTLSTQYEETFYMDQAAVEVATEI